MSDLQTMFKLTWFATSFDVNAEVNNGRGPVDYKVSKGKSNAALVESFARCFVRKAQWCSAQTHRATYRRYAPCRSK